LVALSVACAIGALEVGVRWHHWSEGRPFLADAPFLVRDPELGWRPGRGLRIERRLADASGTPYRARVTTSRDGFRRLASAAPGQPRILFIGDSFTHAIEVGDERAYWAIFARQRPDYAVSAIGAGGYGTLQEALLLDEVAPRLRPDIVIWQLCANDLTNNLFEAERRSVRHNNLERRPYWEQDAIVYRNPAPLGLEIVDRLYETTGLRVLKVAEERGYRLLARLNGADDEAGFGGAEGPALRARAIAVTAALLARSRASDPRRRLLSFSVCDGAAEDAAFRAISKASGLQFLGAYGPRIGALRRPGFEVFAGDGRHLNDNGHAALGAWLAADFAKWRASEPIGAARVEWRARPRSRTRLRWAGSRRLAPAARRPRRAAQKLTVQPWRLT
jgi:lysophospholipase L1-like esterase